jgi:hypothetical protein
MPPITDEEERTQIDGQVSPSDVDSTAEWAQAHALRHYLDNTIATEVQRQVSIQNDKLAKNMDRALAGAVGNQGEMWREIRVLKQENEEVWNWIVGISIIGAISVFTWYLTTLIEAGYARKRDGGRRRRNRGSKKLETETEDEERSAKRKRKY